ncbi:MAG: magnesium transporter [Phycisphaerae bacterium]
MESQKTELLEKIESLLEVEDKFTLRILLQEYRGSDIAEVVETLSEEQKRVIFDLLDKDISAEVLQKVDEATRQSLFHVLTNSELISLILELGLDEAADLLAEMPEEKAEHLLASISPDTAARIKNLMSYSSDSAGGIMDPVLISVTENATVAEAVNKIRNSEIDEDFFSVFVVDAKGVFLGEVRIRLLLTCPEDKKIKELISEDSLYVYCGADQEEVRNIFTKNDLMVLPVIDRQNRLIGQITAGRIIEVAAEEAIEDIYTMAGTTPNERENLSVFHAAGVRMTWLLPCLFGTGVTALVLIFFHKQFEFWNLAIIYTSAVVFVPMIAAISGNAGLQTSAIVVSGLAAGHLAAQKLQQVFVREVRIAAVVAVLCGLAGGVICAVLLHFKNTSGPVDAIRITMAFSLAMFSAIMVATTLGLLLPFLFRKIGIDPAISSGPLVTTANDSISVAIYMTLIMLLISL